MAKQITIRNARGEVVMVIDRNEWERSELEQRRRELRKELAEINRDLRQMRDMHEMEAR